MTLLNIITSVLGFSPAPVAQPKSESDYAPSPVVIDFPPADNGNTISIQHNRSLRTIEIQVFKESSLDYTSFSNGHWQVFSKHEWERVS